jgi:hypothetical protein
MTVSLLPWAWAINGFASIAAASLAPLISVHHGQPAMLAGGLLCYLVAVTVDCAGQLQVPCS